MMEADPLLKVFCYTPQVLTYLVAPFASVARTQRLTVRLEGTCYFSIP